MSSDSFARDVVNGEVVCPEEAASSAGRGDGSWLFFRKFLETGKQVASFFPSSRYFSKKICHHVDPQTPQTIVELGAGTGPATRVAMEKMHPQSRLIAVELDPDLAKVCAARCPRAEVLCCDAQHLPDNLDQLEVDHIDLLLNCLPTPSLPRSVNEKVFRCFAERSDRAWLSQPTVMPLVFRPLYERLFETVEFQFTPLNVPPAGVYHCCGLREGYTQYLPGK